MSAVFPSMVSLYTKYCKIFSYFFQNSRAFITFNLSETLEGRLLGERRLLEEIRYAFGSVTCLLAMFNHFYVILARIIDGKLYEQ